MHILAKEALFVGPVGWFLRHNGVTPVKAGGSDIEAYRAAKAVLDRGEVLCIFPEGTRSSDRRHAGAQARRGNARHALGGPDRRRRHHRQRHVSWPWQAPATLRSRITIRAGKPFTLKLDPSLPRRAAMAAASDELMRHIAELVDERHRGRFASADV